MTEFQAQLRDRAAKALESLREAQATGDSYSVDVHTGELESIQRLAVEHDVHLPELDGFGHDAA